MLGIGATGSVSGWLRINAGALINETKGWLIFDSAAV